MEWYFWLFIISFGLFLIQVVFNVLGFDLDLDFDADGLFEWDIGDFITFKGLLHFLIGFSGTLCTLSKGGFYWYSYIIAILFGLLLMYFLYKLYNWISRLDYKPSELNLNNLVGKRGVIESVIDSNKGIINVLISTGLGKRLVSGGIDVSDGAPHIGDKVEVKSCTNDSLIFTYLTI